MKIAVVLTLMFMCLGVSADDGAAYYGTLGFVNEAIVPNCLNLEGPLVIANYDAFDNACGKTVTITCLDSQYCDVTKPFVAKIANLCNGCDVTFRLSPDDFTSIATGTAVAVNIQYVVSQYVV